VGSLGKLPRCGSDGLVWLCFSSGTLSHVSYVSGCLPTTLLSCESLQPSFVVVSARSKKGSRQLFSVLGAVLSLFGGSWK